MKKSFDVTGLIIATVFIAIVLLWWGIVAMWQPTASIMVASTPYRPIQWIISLVALAIPFSMFVFSRDVYDIQLERKILIVGLAVLTTSMVHNKRCFIDAQIVFFVTTIIYFILDKKRAYRLPLWGYWVVLGYLIWNIVSLTWSVDQEYGIKLVGNLVPIVAYPVMFLAFRLNIDERDGLFKLFWRVALMAVLLSFCSGIYEIMLQGFSISGLIHFKIGMIKETFFDANGKELFVFNMLYGWNGMGHPSYNSIWAMAAALIGCFLVDKRKIGWIEFVFGELIIMELQFAAQSRIGIVMVCIVWVSGYIYLFRNRRKVVFATIAACVMLVVFAFLLHPNILGSFGQDISREQQRQLAFDFIEKKGVLGSGLGGTTGEYVSQVVGYEYPWFEWKNDNIYVHNQFLGDWMQSGIIGLILIVFIVFALFIMSIKKKNYLVFVFVLSMVFFMMIEMPLRFLNGVTLTTFFLCLFFNNHLNDREQDRLPCV